VSDLVVVVVVFQKVIMLVIRCQVVFYSFNFIHQVNGGSFFIHPNGWFHRQHARVVYTRRHTTTSCRCRTREIPDAALPLTCGSPIASATRNPHAKRSHSRSHHDKSATQATAPLLSLSTTPGKIAFKGDTRYPRLPSMRALRKPQPRSLLFFG
jgi:hypothetical protein